MLINSFRGKYFFLSNFYSVPIVYDGISYQNNEAAFQAQKTISKESRRSFQHLNPSQAKAKGRRVQLRNDWEEVKDNIMYEIVKTKFIQHSELRKRLIDTGCSFLEEGNTWGDKYWGTVNSIGKNKLGKILMKVRDELAI